MYFSLTRITAIELKIMYFRRNIYNVLLYNYKIVHVKTIYDMSIYYYIIRVVVMILFLLHLLTQ